MSSIPLQPSGSYTPSGMPHPQQQQQQPLQYFQQPFLQMQHMQQPPGGFPPQHYPMAPPQHQTQSYPPPGMQGNRVPYPHQQQMFPQMINRGISQNLQGVYSTYPARLKQSEENALLLPTSYLTNKKPRFAQESDDDFEEYAEDSDDGTPSSGMRTRSAVAAAQAAANANTASGSIRSTPGSGGVNNGQPAEQSRKIIRKKNHIYPPERELERASKMEEVLVPIRLDIDLEDIKLRDAFLWNMNEQFLAPEKFAEILCEDLELPPARFIQLIAESIRNQVIDFEAVHEVELPSESIRVIINLDLQIGKINLRDRFEWDLNNTSNNAPEIFSKQLAAEAGLGGEYVSIISHAIREQLYRHKRQWVDESLGGEELAEPLVNGFRNIEDAESWAPQMEVLSNEELEKLLIAQERNMRRLRRETRFKRSRRRQSATPSRRPHGTP
ncbi:hypothetical protein BDC45DRAFT_520416 [Circinella umbellata]|nr:hypothetical protein BDC45DRAFT_520416 [Circinella umbellata]